MRHHSSRLVSATANSLREILKGVRSHPLVVLTSISFSRPSASKLRISKPKPSPSCTDVQRTLSARSSRSEAHTSELQSLMRISYAVFCLKKTKYKSSNTLHTTASTRQVHGADMLTPLTMTATPF